jgi:hypothetical protein
MRTRKSGAEVGYAPVPKGLPTRSTLISGVFRLVQNQNKGAYCLFNGQWRWFFGRLMKLPVGRRESPELQAAMPKEWIDGRKNCSRCGQQANPLLEGPRDRDTIGEAVGSGASAEAA